MYLRIVGIGGFIPPQPVNMRCPHCGTVVVFDYIGQDLACSVELTGQIGTMSFGQRRCPNVECQGHIFCVLDVYGKLYSSFPPSRVDLDKEKIPLQILETFEEAISCHSIGAYVASAIMVRRTLEEICADRGASGKDLKTRIQDLKTKIVLPQELIDAMDELRLLGNDAAHLEAKTYDNISQEELDVAIEFTKEILKALYQYSSLLDKMRSLKKTP